MEALKREHGLQQASAVVSIYSSNFSSRISRAYPLLEIRQEGPCRAIRGNSISVNSTLPPLKDSAVVSLAKLWNVQTELMLMLNSNVC